MNKQQGFSLFEIIVGLTVGLFLIAGVLSVFSSMKLSAKKINLYGELQENGRLAMNLLTNDLMHQSFWGNFAGELNYSVLQSVPNALSGDCIGEGVNNRTFPQENGHFRTLWGETLTTKSTLECINNAKVGSDIIQLKRVLTSPVGSTNLNNDRFYLIANVFSGAIFDGDSEVPNIDDGVIWEYQHHIYYVREDTIAGEKVPILMRGRLDSDNKPFHFSTILDGIEYLHFIYGVDANNDGSVNAFLSANEMTDQYWDSESGAHVSSITVYILVRELVADKQYENLNTYYLGDLALSFIDKNGKGDNYHRLLLTSTIHLPNSGVDTW